MVIVADFLTHTSTMPGNVNGFDISSDIIFIFVSVCSLKCFTTTLLGKILEEMRMVHSL